MAPFGVRANVPGYHPGVTVVEPLARDRNPDVIMDTNPFVSWWQSWWQIWLQPFGMSASMAPLGEGANKPTEVNISVAPFGVRANVPGYHPGVTVVEPLAQ